MTDAAYSHSTNTPIFRKAWQLARRLTYRAQHCLAELPIIGRIFHSRVPRSTLKPPASDDFMAWSGEAFRAHIMAIRNDRTSTADDTRTLSWLAAGSSDESYVGLARRIVLLDVHRVACEMDASNYRILAPASRFMPISVALGQEDSDAAGRIEILEDQFFEMTAGTAEDRAALYDMADMAFCSEFEALELYLVETRTRYLDAFIRAAKAEIDQTAAFRRVVGRCAA